MSSASGRHRASTRQYSAEEQALNQISKEAESRLAAKRAARAEAREIRLKEIERQQKQEEERQKSHDVSSDSQSSRVRNDYNDSRRGSDDSSSAAEEMDTSRDHQREMRAKIREMDEKYKKAMMMNAQLDNEKHSLVYKVELMKDQMEEMEESFTQLQREYKDKCRDLEMQKRNVKDMEFDYNVAKEQLAIKEKLIQESGLVIVSSDEGVLSLEKCLPNGQIPQGGGLLISSDAAELLEKAGVGSLDDRLRSFLEEKTNLLKEIKGLKDELEEEKSKREHKTSSVPQINGPEMQLYEVQREASKQIHEYKLKLQKAEQDITNLEGTVTRLETQVKRYRTESEESEKLEDELKTEKRKLQRELREAQTRVEELTNQNKHLQNRIEKMKQARALASQ
ncbi:leucine-rich repeat flightless-interacting protein 2-like isoform X1 [Saccostrea echinata]|uniref:leucine-rich repeat flightless-interacting protein 2-like isoform X1 n=1 Tax=Saccostrea echinata TaxID=191078 RepID=UPI002A7F718A|nr:leucine-rich repeat flightless-interacting protein 2-like isoform X1 [Saccostrea echinata]